MTNCRFCGTPRRVNYNRDHLTVGPLAGYGIKRCKGCRRILFITRIDSAAARQQRIQKGLSDNMRSRFGEILTPHGHRAIEYVLRTGYLPIPSELEEKP